MLVDQQRTQPIIDAFYRVYQTLGSGFLEKVYERAMFHELTIQGLAVEPQYPIQVFYDGVIVGEYFADLFVNKEVIVEIEAADSISPAHEAQLVNYLRGTQTPLGLLLNFGPKPQVRRKILTPET
ncbi:GxxExxY protein [Blastopirellula sp. JC732]|uniref:GxxExxY protein n=1 Tax=Blastopirellula sediminis TaxID=2894196 RepID=A0A9X1MS86_9BACT|nr:GxxExxY protein [Blastopirellula sediminis]MCC9605598.1 GxxExxY protein [Blastopirellula sediminis]MCC9631102.1 GxxExxY protein [Blastopirellula sediminis]